MTNANISIPHFTDVICEAQPVTGQCKCTETCARLAHFTDPLSTKAEKRSLKRGRREMYTSYKTVVLSHAGPFSGGHKSQLWLHLLSLFIIVHMLYKVICAT
jgi:hypothetical protein